jgi:hypothetical protein
MSSGHGIAQLLTLQHLIEAFIEQRSPISSAVIQHTSTRLIKLLAALIYSA